MKRYVLFFKQTSESDPDNWTRVSGTYKTAHEAEKAREALDASPLLDVKVEVIECEY